MHSPSCSNRVWMAPAGQGRCSVAGFGRSRPCVRRLMCSVAAARPDEVRRRSGPDQWHALGGASVRTGCPDCRFAVLSPSPHVAPHRLGADLRRRVLSDRGCPVAFAAPDERPDDPRHPVGQGDGHHLHRLSLQHLPKPVGPGSSAAPACDLRHGAEVEQASQVTVSSLRDPPEPLLAAARMGLRREPEPGGIVSRGAERRDVGR